jgi:apolipoprotein N-acyltransferase
MTADNRRREGLAALSGVLLALSFPKFGHPAVAWVALAPLLIALTGTSGWRAVRLGYVSGAVSSLGLLYWTALVVTQYGGLHLAVSVLIMVLLCLAVALFPALFGWLAALLIQSFGTTGLLLAPFAWVATEILRGHTLLNFSWCLLGYSQQPYPHFIQIASYTAVYGVSFVVAATSAALAFLAAERGPRARAVVAAAASLLVAAVAVHGAAALRRPLRESGRLRVGLVQASIRQDEKWDADKLARNVDRHVALTRDAVDQGAQLVVWPESAVPFEFDRDPAIAADLTRLTREADIHLLFGNDDREPGQEGRDRLFVGAKMLTPDGRVSLRYHKVRLVPFGEYVPLQRVLTLGGRFAAKLVRRVSDFTPGKQHVVGELNGARLSVSICYEAIFADFIRGFVDRGADLLVNVTNDGWYGYTSAPHQHFAMAVFRAVENGKYLVRAANTGISAVVDPRGRVLARTQLFEETTLVFEVPIVPGRTFYSRHGDVFAWTCFGVAVLLVAYGLVSSRRRFTS